MYHFKKINILYLNFLRPPKPINNFLERAHRYRTDPWACENVNTMSDREMGNFCDQRWGPCIVVVTLLQCTLPILKDVLLLPSLS